LFAFLLVLKERLGATISRKVWRIVRTPKRSTESHIFGRAFAYFIEWFTYRIGVVYIVTPPFSTAL
jgi:hypothetical protein